MIRAIIVVIEPPNHVPLPLRLFPFPLSVIRVDTKVTEVKDTVLRDLPEGTAGFFNSLSPLFISLDLVSQIRVQRRMN